MTADDWIAKLSLQPHPEGGYFAEVYRAPQTVTDKKGEGQSPRTRSALTSIYFLLTNQSPSHFHVLGSDEIWYAHAGDSATLHLFYADGRYEERRIGLRDELQVIIPAGTHFAAELSEGEEEEERYLLVSCAVAPGFDFADFALSSRAELRARFPERSALIDRLCLRD